MKWLTLAANNEVVYHETWQHVVTILAMVEWIVLSFTAHSMANPPAAFPSRVPMLEIHSDIVRLASGRLRCREKSARIDGDATVTVFRVRR